MSTNVGDAALRMALRQMLRDIAFPEEMKSAPWTLARLVEPEWLPTTRDQLKALALRWGRSQGTSVEQALRRALGEEIDRDPVPTTTTAPASTGMPARASTQSSRRSQVDSITDLTEETTIMTPEFERELAIVAHEFERPPYWFPDDTARLARAVSLVREGKVTRNPDNTYDVVGSRGTIYTCREECPCPQGQKAKSKWCAHLIAVQVYGEVQVRVPPTLFAMPKTVDERLAGHAPTAAQDAPGATNAPQDDISRPPTVPETIVEPSRGSEESSMDTSVTAAPPVLDETQLKTYRQTIVKQLAALGHHPKDKTDFEDVVMTQVGLVLAPENFPLITARLSEILTARAKTAPAPIPEDYFVDIKGKKHVLFAGLLAMAHDRGLLQLAAEFVSVTADLAVAKATASFSDGRRFSEAGEATPGNVGPQVKPHFARMALTRAKARCLRDALNVSQVTVEEIE